jgi:hypothetical protein
MMPSTHRKTRITVIALGELLPSKAGFTCLFLLGACKLRHAVAGKSAPLDRNDFVDGFAKSMGIVILGSPRWVTNR